MAANNTKLTAAEFFRKYSDIITEAEQINELSQGVKDRTTAKRDSDYEAARDKQSTTKSGKRRDITAKNKAEKKMIKNHELNTKLNRKNNPPKTKGSLTSKL